MPRNEQNHQADADPDWVLAHSPVRGAPTESSDSDFYFELPKSNQTKPTSKQEQDMKSESADPAEKTATAIAASPATEKKPKTRKPRAPPKNELPIAVAARLDADLAIVQVHGINLDMSGDVGVVGRVKVENEQNAKIDLKGVLYDVAAYPTNGTVCILTIGANDAKITSFMDSAVAIKTERIDDDYQGAENDDVFDADEHVNAPVSNPRTKAKRGRGRSKAKRRK